MKQKKYNKLIMKNDFTQFLLAAYKTSNKKSVIWLLNKFIINKIVELALIIRVIFVP